MHSRKADGPPSKGSARKARKGARARSAKWNKLREEEAYPSRPADAESRLPVLLPAGKAGWQDTSAAAFWLPVGAGLLLVLSAMLSLPILGQTWRPWGLLALAAALYLAHEARKSWSRNGVRRRGVIGVIVGLSVVFFFAVGIVTQAAPQGQPLLPGTTAERTYTEGQSALSAARILSENAKFLSLSSEEIVTLGPLLEEARAQALSIGDAWNPVTGQEPPVPAMLEVRARVSRAAIKQAQALEIAQTIAVSPEAALAAQVEALITETADLLGQGPQSVNAALDQAAYEAGLGERFPRDS